MLTPLLLNRKDNLVERLIERLTEAASWWSHTQRGTLPPRCHSHLPAHALHRTGATQDDEGERQPLCRGDVLPVGSRQRARPAKAKYAREAVKKLIQKNRLTPSNYRIADGSGLSLYNYVSPELLTRLLRYAWRNSNISEYLIPALPIAGVDGTLKNRMKNTAAEGNVHAKTGTLTGISSLAGYCTAPNGHILSFVIINQGVLRNSDGRTFQDRVCNALCKP